jgi:hypothetical protein
VKKRSEERREEEKKRKGEGEFIYDSGKKRRWNLVTS